MDSPDQHRKAVLITGASGGLGKALVRRFTAEGWQVVATDINDLSLAEFSGNKAVRIFRVDIGSDDSVKETFDKLIASGEMLDLIINNAGIDDYFPLSEAPVSRFMHILNINVLGAYRINQVFLPILRSPGGRIIHIGSESLHIRGPFMPYPLTKNLLESYARALRIELKFRGIDVMIMRPGAIQTPLLHKVSALEKSHHQWILGNIMKKFGAQAPAQIGRIADPDEVADYIFKVSKVKNPRAVYRINNMLKLRISALLPSGFTEWVMLKMLS